MISNALPKILLAGALALVGASAASAALHRENVTYTQGGNTFIGYLVYDDALQGLRPGVVVVHEWMGLNDYAKHRADQLAEMGYVAFAADMYGNGRVATSTAEAGKLAGALKNDRPLMRARINAALDALKKQATVDRNRLAAIGYCFGGTTALELARSGAEVLGVVSFHGGLDSPTPADASHIRGKVLVLHGADDPNVPPTQVAAFQEEMRKGRVDWQMNYYSGAVHGFTNPANGGDPSKGVAYNEAADRRSWEAMKTFFAEIFKPR